MSLVPFFCPKHGKVLDAFPTALVECNRPGCEEQPCAPEGEDPKEHRKRYFTARRVSKHRTSRKRYIRPPGPLVNQGS